MSFDRLARSYLNKLQGNLRQASETAEFTPELSYRPVTDEFIRALCRQICEGAGVVFEPKVQASAGRPDWRIYNEKNYGLYGYVEGKPIDCANSLQVSRYADQLDKYLSLDAKVILTDGLDFAFFESGSEKPEVISLIAKPVGVSQLSEATLNSDLDRAFREFLKEPSFRIFSETALIRECARRARNLARDVEAFVEMPPDSGLTAEEENTITALHDLKHVLECHHDQTLNSVQNFAEFVSQVLIFGLLYAYRVVSEPGDTPKLRDAKIQQFWTDAVFTAHARKLSPFSALASLLGNELKSLGRIGTWYSDCRLMLAHTDLGVTRQAKPDFHKLYEYFLDEFDSHAKFDYGAFCTPKPLAQYALRISEAILNECLPTRSLFEADNKIIDPCCGTGTYLELLVQAASRARTFPRIAGFEILPAPYALANYRLATLDVDPAAIKQTSIVLTNTLSDALEQFGYPVEAESAATQIIIKEQIRARELSKPSLILIIGNPPSSDSPRKGDARNFKNMDRLIDDFRPPRTDRRARQNVQKQVRNEFMFFLRWACSKMEDDSSVGIFSFIIPSSFLENPSYAPARYWLIDHFHGLWVLEIDTDLRRGVSSENLFETQQGRCLLIGIRKPVNAENAACSVRFATIAALSKHEKLRYLSNKKEFTPLLTDYRKLGVAGPGFFFRPVPRSCELEFLYDTFWPLCPEDSPPDDDKPFIFARHCSGLKLAPSNLLVHTKRPILLRRSKEVARLTNGYEAIRREWFAGQRRPPARDKLTEAVRKALGNAATNPSAVHVYSYRPFLQMCVLLTPDLLHALRNAPGGGTRSRPEVMSAFRNEQVIGLAVAPSPKELSGDLAQFASFCWNLPDNDLSRRGNAHVFCNFFPEYKTRTGVWSDEPNSNVNPTLVKALGTDCTDGLPSETAVVFYCYAVLCSRWYLRRFEPILYSINKWPRIPFPENRGKFLILVQLGRKLAELEKPSRHFAPDEKNRVLVDRWEDFKVMSHKIDTVSGMIKLRGEAGQFRVISDFESKVLTFRVGGHKILDQWLKFHSHAHTRSKFKRADIMELLSVRSRILKHLDLVKEVDIILKSFANNPDELMPSHLYKMPT